MMSRFTIVVSVIACQLPVLPLNAQDDAQKPQQELWIQDFAKAKAEAKAAQKDLLVDFTGSDWCGWCIKLDSEVFSQEAFRTTAPQHFVLVKLDYPRNENLVTKEIRAQNEQLQSEYSIQGFPTILLMDDEGRVYAQTGYQQGGPDSYNEMLAGLREKGSGFKAALAVAAKQAGVERAKTLDDALGQLEEEVADAYHFALMQEIVAIDADGKAGLKDKYDAKVKKIELNRQIQQASQELGKLVNDDMQSGDGDKAIAKLDAVIQEPKNTMRHQMALFFKGMIIMDTSGDAKAAIAALEAGQKLAPDSPIGQRIAQVLPEIKKQSEDGKKDGGEQGGK